MSKSNGLASHGEHTTYFDRLKLIIQLAGIDTFINRGRSAAQARVTRFPRPTRNIKRDDGTRKSRGGRPPARLRPRPKFRRHPRPPRRRGVRSSTPRWRTPRACCVSTKSQHALGSLDIARFFAKERLPLFRRALSPLRPAACGYLLISCGYLLIYWSHKAV